MTQKGLRGKGRVFLNRESRLHAAKALCTALAPLSHSWDELRELACAYIDEAVQELESADSSLTYNMLRDVSMLAAKAEEEGNDELAAIFAVVSSAIANDDSKGLYPHISRYVETDLPYKVRKTLAEITAERTKAEP